MGNGEEFYGDVEREFLTDSLFLIEKQMEIEQEYEQWKKEKIKKKEATIIVGKPRKRRKFEKYGTITTKLPRIIQYRNRRISRHSEKWY